MTGPDLSGKQLGRYRVTEKIAAGGMGIVYRAHDERLQRDVALKVLPEGTLADEDARRRFRTEALTLSKLNHPNIAVIHDFNTLDDVDFLVMELVEGGSLSGKIGTDPLAARDTARIGVQIAEAIEAATEQGIVHRDLKPDNVMVTEKGQVKVLDFGLARWHAPPESDVTAVMTEARSVVGTLPYMSPEQLRAEQVDARSDIYALGAILYEMATGRRAFPERGQADLTDAILNRSPVTPRAVSSAIAPELESIILKCLEKDPDLRYQTAKEVAVDLRRLGGTTATHSEIRVPARRSRGKKRTLVLIGAVAGLVGAFSPILINRLAGPDEPVPGTIDGNARTIVVLPFENLGSPDDSYFADGITEEITSRLAQIGGLRVISRTSAVYYAGTSMSLQEIGAELGVGTVLEGTIRTDRHPDGTGTVRVTPQLIRVSDDTHLWADRYTVDLVPGEIFEVQAEIAEHVAAALDVTLLQSEEEAIHDKPTENLQAYDAYLLGRYYWNKRSREGILAALGHFQRAVELDPHLARGHVGVADSYQLFGVYNVGDISQLEAANRAEKAVRRALELDPDLAEAHTSLASILHNRYRDFAGAEAAFRKAIELDPEYAVAYYWFSELYGTVGDYETMVALNRKAISLDPGSAIAHHLLSMGLRETGRLQESIEASQRALELAPKFNLPHNNLAGIYFQLGNQDRFELEMNRTGYPPFIARIIMQVLRDSLTTEDAGALFDEFKRQGSGAPSVYGEALVRALIGEDDTVLDLLEESYRRGESGLITLRLMWSFRHLRDHPRFVELVSRTGLDFEPQSWP